MAVVVFLVMMALGLQGALLKLWDRTYIFN
jgi:hypothetical protein